MFCINIIERIVTHGGRAHRDDFMAVCYAEAAMRKPVPVERRDPTPEELDNPQVLVLDVGGVHDPAKSNFDHHQLERDAEPECALSLLLKATGDFEDFNDILLWVHPTMILDSKGPIALQRELGISKESLARMNSPVEAIVLKLFESGALAPQFLADIGANQIRYVEKIRSELEKIICGAGRSIELLPDVVGTFINGLFEPKSIGLYRQLVEKVTGKTMAFSICHDDRGEGLTLYRYDDHPRIDFSRLEGRPEVIFAHKGGFIAKSKGRDHEEALNLVRESIVAANEA